MINNNSSGTQKFGHQLSEVNEDFQSNYAVQERSLSEISNQSKDGSIDTIDSDEKAYIKKKLEYQTKLESSNLIYKSSLNSRTMELNRFMRQTNSFDLEIITYFNKEKCYYRNLFLKVHNLEKENKMNHIKPGNFQQQI